MTLKDPFFQATSLFFFFLYSEKMTATASAETEIESKNQCGASVKKTRGQSYKTFYTLGQIYKLALKLDNML